MCTSVSMKPQISPTYICIYALCTFFVTFMNKNTIVLYYLSPLVSFRRQFKMAASVGAAILIPWTGCGSLHASRFARKCSK